MDKAPADASQNDQNRGSIIELLNQIKNETNQSTIDMSQYQSSITSSMQDATSSITSFINTISDKNNKGANSEFTVKTGENKDNEISEIRITLESTHNYIQGISKDIAAIARDISNFIKQPEKEKKQNEKTTATSISKVATTGKINPMQFMERSIFIQESILTEVKKIEKGLESDRLDRLESDREKKDTVNRSELVTQKEEAKKGSLFDLLKGMVPALLAALPEIILGGIGAALAGTVFWEINKAIKLMDQIEKNQKDTSAIRQGLAAQAETGAERMADRAKGETLVLGAPRTVTKRNEAEDLYFKKQNELDDLEAKFKLKRKPGIETKYDKRTGESYEFKVGDADYEETKAKLEKLRKERDQYYAEAKQKTEEMASEGPLYDFIKQAAPKIPSTLAYSGGSVFAEKNIPQQLAPAPEKQSILQNVSDAFADVYGKEISPDDMTLKTPKIGETYSNKVFDFRDTTPLPPTIAKSEPTPEKSKSPEYLGPQNGPESLKPKTKPTYNGEGDKPSELIPTPSKLIQFEPFFNGKNKFSPFPGLMGSPKPWEFESPQNPTDIPNYVMPMPVQNNQLSINKVMELNAQLKLITATLQQQQQKPQAVQPTNIVTDNSNRTFQTASAPFYRMISDEMLRRQYYG